MAMAMLGYVDWSQFEGKEDSKGGKGNADSIFLKFKPGKHRVRLLGKPYAFLQTFIPKKLTGLDKDLAITSPGPDNDPLMKLNVNPQQRWAINVLHRDDGNKLKIMRFGAAVYKHIHDYAAETGIDPADIKKGIDIVINVTDPGNNPRNRQYTVTPLNNTPIKKTEADKIKTDGGLYELKKYFSPTPIEKINEYIEQYNLLDKCSKTSGEDTDFEDGHTSGKDTENLEETENAADDEDDDDDDDESKGAEKDDEDISF